MSRPKPHLLDDVLRAEAERRVIAVRGSVDAPGFEACVEAEIAAMRREGTPEKP